jgi:hypothetical protein
MWRAQESHGTAPRDRRPGPATARRRALLSGDFRRSVRRRPHDREWEALRGILDHDHAVVILAVSIEALIARSVCHRPKPTARPTIRALAVELHSPAPAPSLGRRTPISKPMLSPLNSVNGGIERELILSVMASLGPAQQAELLRRIAAAFAHSDQVTDGNAARALALATLAMTAASRSPQRHCRGRVSRSRSPRRLPQA